MKVFLTGGTGFIGSHVLPHLIKAGHTVTALSRSEKADAALKKAGATPVRGDLTTLPALTEATKGVDAVIHTAFIHDFNSPTFDMQRNVAVDGEAIKALAAGLRPGGIFINSSGALFIAPGQLLTEDNEGDPAFRPGYADYLKEKGIVPIIIRLSPTTHGYGDHGFLAILIDAAKKNGVAAYVDDGSARWSAVHVDDAGKLYAQALEKGQAGYFHGAGEEGVPQKDVAEVIASKLGIEAKSIPKDQAPEHFGFIGRLLGIDHPVSNKITKEKLGWTPTSPGVLESLKTVDTYWN